MKKDALSRLTFAYLVCFCIAFLACADLKANGLILRQRVFFGGEAILAAGLLLLLVLWRRRTPPSETGKRRALAALLALTVILGGAALALQALFGAHTETVEVIDGQKTVRVERDYLMSFDVTHYPYVNPLCCRAFPRIVEQYDDGYDQFLYTDYYDETGALTRRVWADGTVEQAGRAPKP